MAEAMREERQLRAFMLLTKRAARMSLTPLRCVKVTGTLRAMLLDSTS